MLVVVPDWRGLGIGRSPVEKIVTADEGVT